MSFDCPAWPPDWPEIRAAINAAIDSGQWGRYRSEQQERLKQMIGQSFSAAHVRLCSSGSAAIEIALRVAAVGADDEVLVAAYDYPGNLRTIELVGARPVLVDVDQSTLAVDPHQLADAASENVRAVIASHLYGNAADVVNLREQCDQRGWILIEDACQVPGMTIRESAAGTIGHLGTLSFGGSKPLTAGNGGAVLTNESSYAVKMDAMLDRPSDANPLSVLQAAALLPQVMRLTQCNQRRVETIRFLETNIIPRLESWRWQSPLTKDVQPTHYKIAWTARSSEHRAAIVSRAADLGLPIGAGFRSMSRSSERRCRKPVPLDRAACLGETVFVLDHAALLLEKENQDHLGELLVQLERETK